VFHLRCVTSIEGASEDVARQRFIWPDLWSDPVIGRLKPIEQVFFIGGFSIADDKGRALADPVYLKAEIFRYQNDITADDVRRIRDVVVARCRSLVLYVVNGTEYMAYLRWHEYQHTPFSKASSYPSPPSTAVERCPMRAANMRPERHRLRIGLPPGLRFRILKRDNFSCRYCGRRPPEVVLHIDHLVPVSRGGTNEPGNLITACSLCNLGKADKVLGEGVDTCQTV